MSCSWIIVALSGLCLGVAAGQVRIHDPVVSLLAKPYGIEKRIELRSIDGLHTAANGAKRLVFTLRNSGVKEVRLKRPEFSLELVMPDGKWARLGTLSGCGIRFPVTGEDATTDRTYVATLESHLDGKGLEAHLRQAAAAGRRVRMIGRAEMVVVSEGEVQFSKKNLKLEVHGPLELSGDFECHRKAHAGQLPEPGLKDS